VRFAIKTALGLPSFITMALTRRHQAVHDRLTHTTVQVRDLTRASSVDVAWERPESEMWGRPPAIRRVLVIIAYLAGSVVLLAFVAGAVLSAPCAYEKRCSGGEEFVNAILGIGWMALAASLIIAGWRGRLYGARKRAVAIQSPAA
jgi:hypothetical protein